MGNEKVLILLATYNGQDYIHRMIDSVLAQDHQNLQIILSDDCSLDATPSILQEYADREPDKIIFYRSGTRFGNAQKHFMHLLSKFHDAPYIMLCDQDDVWYPNKISLTLEAMKNTQVSEDVPALVHTDLRVVDRDLNEIAPSFCKNAALDGHDFQLKHLLVQNVVTGCTVMINRALAVLAGRNADAEAVLMHDWWLALIAASCGTACFLEIPTIDYRQHGSNSVGAKNVHSLRYLMERLCSGDTRKVMDKAARQAEVFLRIYEDVLQEQQKVLIGAFSSTCGARWFQRNRVYLKHGLLKRGFVRRAAQLLGI